MEKLFPTTIVLGLIQVILLTLFGFYFYRMTHHVDVTPGLLAPLFDTQS